jgi:hypothetical protein
MRIYFLLVTIWMADFAQAQDFPQKFLGSWEGKLQWYQTGKKAPQEIKMQLNIQPADTAGHYYWQFVYGNNEDDRPYILKAVDTAMGHWVIDERNGIELDQYWVGNRLNGAFTVQNSTIVNSYWLKGDKLIVEFFSIGTKPVNKTGGASKEVPSVESYPVKSFQKAILERVDKLKD